MSEKTMKNNSSGRKEGGDTHTVQKDTIALELSSMAIPILFAEGQMQTFKDISLALQGLLQIEVARYKKEKGF